MLLTRCSLIPIVMVFSEAFTALGALNQEHHQAAVVRFFSAGIAVRIR